MDALREFLIIKKMTIKHFCLKNGFNYRTFRQMMCKSYNPSPAMALKISRATRGKVGVIDLLYPKNGKKKAA